MPYGGNYYIGELAEKFGIKYYSCVLKYAG
jgi:hypothetical protein